MSVIRAFVSVPLDDAVRRALVALEGELAAAAPRVRWVDAADLHITLKFLGAVEDVAAVEAAVGGALSGVRAFDVEVIGTGGFPDAARPRVVWAGVGDGAEALGAMAHAVERAVEPLGFAREERGFRAHVTLARIKERAPAGLAAALAARARRAVGRVRVERVELMRSNPGAARGAMYTPIAAFPLEAA